jgi:ribosomal protein S18 acetylase RimI-like enzyme
MVRGDGAVKRCLLVADAAGVVGFAVGMVAGDLGELESVAVEQAWQRRGVGEALCRAVLNWCRAEGAAEVGLEVRAASLGARQLYARVGFVEAGLRRGYYESPADNAVLMRLKV